jgi:DNA segregation ATPase FtsK/SpoIIIE, S-DNA-T family
VKEDELYQNAVEWLKSDYIQLNKFVSASMIQRRFRVGYTPAAKIIERLDESGYISAANKFGQRQVLV